MRTRVNRGLDWVEMDNGLQQLGEAIAAALPGAITGISTDYGELSLRH
jgi:flagellar motor component MotA